MPNENIMVTLSMERYEELLEAKTRVDIAVERIIHDQYILTEDILRILGTAAALDEAERIKKERAERKRKEEAAKEKEPGHEL